MEKILDAFVKEKRPVRVIQFGTGVFLRGFVDWMLEIVNEKTDWNGSVAMIKSTARGNTDALKRQDGMYTVTLRGLVDGKPAVTSQGIAVVNRIISASEEYSAYAALARQCDLRFVVSNTTEAGIAEDEGDAFELCPPRSFPGKLTRFLYERAEHFDYAPDKGLIVLPCELIDDNGATLKHIVLRLAQRWQLGERFVHWVQENCAFANTLVDRIVTGWPADAEQLWEDYGYRDEAIVTVEPYALWVIACEKDVEKELPLQKAGLPVVYTDDLAAYRTRKVRILNGAHTSFVPAAFLAGYEIVRDAVQDADFAGFIEKTLQEEIMPTIDLPLQQLVPFVQSVLERFANPYIDHKLLAICLNSVSKWRMRILPVVLDSSQVPQRLAFSLAALVTLYRTHPDVVQDDEEALRWMKEKELAEILHSKMLWGMDLWEISGFAQAVQQWAVRIQTDGVRACIRELGA